MSCRLPLLDPAQPLLELGTRQLKGSRLGRSRGAEAGALGAEHERRPGPGGGVVPHHQTARLAQVGNKMPLGRSAPADRMVHRSLPPELTPIAAVGYWGAMGRQGRDARKDPRDVYREVGLQP